jgi:TRAP-type mannitol/chloroaromatic compound transport system substrate-binding protein
MTRDGRNTRRKFLKGAAVAGAAIAAPAVVKAQGPISMRWQSTWPSKDIFHENKSTVRGCSRTFG